MSDSGKAVFLSYASQDAEAARRIADALRAFGVEVWFDQSELRGGDAWDQKIRKQIHECALFLPLISATTQERGEGYFRREWKLAVERTHDMAEGVPFIVPVVVDDIPEASALVPEQFLRVQWTRLPHGVPTPQFIEQVRKLLEAPHKPAVQRSESRGQRAAGQTTPGRSGLPGWAWGALAAIVVVAAIAWFATRTSGPSAAPPKPVAEAKPAAPAVSDKSIAVLPFENLSTEQENAFFASGVHEDLLTDLSKIRSFRVISRTSVLRYRERPDNVRQIARELGVAYIVEGAVRRAGNRVLVTAQLIDGRSDVHLWSDNFEEELNDLFAIQRRIAEQIAGQLRIQLTPEERASLAVPPPTNVEAYRLFQEGRDLEQGSAAWSSVGNDPQQLQAAIVLLKKAVALDPGYLRAWAEMSVALAAQAGLLREPERSEALAEGEHALEKTRAIAPADPWTHFAHASFDYLARGYGHFDDALAELAPALAAAPRESEFLRLQARILRRRGDLAQAMAKNEEALTLDPNNVALLRERWENIFGIRCGYAESVRAAARLVDLKPTFPLWRYEQVRAAFLATADTARVADWRTLTDQHPMLAPKGSQEDNELTLWQWQNDRAALVQFAEQPSRQVTNWLRWRTIAMLRAAEETDRARALAAELVKRLEPVSTTSAANEVVYAAGAHLLLDDRKRAQELLGQFKLSIENDHDAWWRMRRRNLYL